MRQMRLLERGIYGEVKAFRDWKFRAFWCPEAERVKRNHCTGPERESAQWPVRQPEECGLLEARCWTSFKEIGSTMSSAGDRWRLSLDNKFYNVRYLMNLRKHFCWPDGRQFRREWEVRNWKQWLYIDIFFKKFCYKETQRM